MAGAAVLRVIEGGAGEPRVAFASAPEIAGVLSLDRIPPPPNRWSTARIALAVVFSVAMHAGLIAWGLQHLPDEEARAAGGNNDTMVSEGISVVLVDSLPSDASDGAEALPEAKQVAAEATARPIVPAGLARPVETEARAVQDAAAPAPVAAAVVPRAVADDTIAPTPEPVAPVASSSIVAPLVEDAASAAPTDAATVVAESDTVPAVADTATTVAAESSTAAVHADDAALSPRSETTIAPDVSQTAAPVEGDQFVTGAEARPAAAVADRAPKIPSVDTPVARPIEDEVSQPAAEPQIDSAKPVDDATTLPVRETEVAAVMAVEEPPTDIGKPTDDASPAPVEDKKVAAAEGPPPAAKEPPMPKPVTVKPKPTPAPRSEQLAASVADTAARAPVRGAAGAGGASSEERGGASTSDYQAKLAAHLRRYRTFPEEARRRGISGIATVRFTVNAAGAVTGASLAKSSGEGILDAAAVAMVHRASPFPPIPANLGVSVLTVNVPVRFDLR